MCRGCIVACACTEESGEVSHPKYEAAIQASSIESAEAILSFQRERYFAAVVINVPQITYNDFSYRGCGSER